MVEIPNEEYRDLSGRLKKLLDKLNQHLKLLEDMRKKAFELERLHKKKDSFFYTSIFLLEFSQFTSLLTFLRELDARLDQYALGAGKMRLVPLLPAVIYTAKPHGDYGATFVSENVKEQTGYKPEDFIKDSKFWARHLHPDDKKHVFAKLPCLVEKGHWAMKYRFKHKDRSYRWMYEESRMIYDEKGKPKEIIGYWIDITALKQAEEALKASEEKWRTLVENAPDVIMEVSRDGKITNINRTVPGLSVEQVIGKNVADFMPPDQIGKAMDAIKEVFKTGEPTTYEVAGVGPQGSTAHYFTNVGPIVCDGKVVSTLHITRDISQRKRAEEAVRSSQKRLQFLVSSNPAVIYASKPYGDYAATFISENCTRQMGYEAQEFTEPGFWSNHIHPEDRERVFAELPDLFKTGEYAHEYRFLYKDGRYRWMYDEMKLIRDANGEPLEILGYWLDITERKQAQKEKEDSEQRLKILFEEAPDAYFLGDLEGRFVDCNKAAERLTGYTREEIIGKSISELRLLPPDQIPVAFKARDEAIEHKITGLVEYTFNRKDRTQAKVEIKAHLVNLKNKTLMLGIVRDITARRLAEQELIVKDQLIGSSVTAVTISDPKGALEYVNDAFLKMWGYDSEAEVLGRSAENLWKEKGKASKAMVILEQEGSWEGKLVARRKDGSAFEVHISARVAKGKEGKPIGMTASFIDQAIWEILAASSTAIFE